MSIEVVKKALRSSASLVVVEAPAGCGKTHQGASFAQETASTLDGGRLLILTHTHAASDVFASRTASSSRYVEIRTIDSLIGQIATAYHGALSLPADVGLWARASKDGYVKLAEKAAQLLSCSPIIARSLAHRYPIVVCDEHQDANLHQHSVIMSLLAAGAKVRIFGDPMQCIYGSSKQADSSARSDQQWIDLKSRADRSELLDEPKRWDGGSEKLGQWIMSARDALSQGSSVDLCTSLPPGVSVLVADNTSPRTHGGFQLSKEHGGPIRKLVSRDSDLLILAAFNETVNALNAFFGRQIPIWEGHVRESITELVTTLASKQGDPDAVAVATIKFMASVATGFTPSGFTNCLLAEVKSRCDQKRKGKALALQSLGRMLIAQPNHKGVSNLLSTLHERIKYDSAFQSIKIDYRREFWDAVKLADFNDVNEGLAELSRRRAYLRSQLPRQALSTIHKAKGHESKNVLVIPVDSKHFGDTVKARRLLYVALSRASQSLTLVVPSRESSPVIRI